MERKHRSFGFISTVAPCNPYSSLHAYQHATSGRHGGPLTCRNTRDAVPIRSKALETIGRKDLMGEKIHVPPTFRVFIGHTWHVRASADEPTSDSRTIRLFSPSKVNLFLRVLRRREDGYHDLASLFQAIGLGDRIEFTLDDSLNGDDVLTSDNPSLPVDRSNLILRAIDLFRKKTGTRTGVRAHIEKRVPMEAGLGGGSANAATALWAMNELTGAGIAPEELAEWGAEFGSDISFFMSQGTAYCTSRGEEVASMDPLAWAGSTRVHIIKPAEGLSTGRIFKSLDLSRTSRADPVDLLARFRAGTATPNDYINDLEDASFRELPLLADLKCRLQEQFRIVLMSGSGTSFFCMGYYGGAEEDIRAAEGHVLSWDQPRVAPVRGAEAGASTWDREVDATQGPVATLPHRTSPAPIDMVPALADFPTQLRCYTTTFINREPGQWYQEP